jgi:hypothetical protein
MVMLIDEKGMLTLYAERCTTSKHGTVYVERRNLYLIRYNIPIVSIIFVIGIYGALSVFFSSM